MNSPHSWSEDSNIWGLEGLRCILFENGKPIAEAPVRGSDVTFVIRHNCNPTHFSLDVPLIGGPTLPLAERRVLQQDDTLTLDLSNLSIEW